LFARYGDFYKIDPLLFSPAEVTFVNLKTGNCQSFGRTEQTLLRKSFFGE
jgi:methenyltetrahydromethanopterin cyclohydrolase